MKTNTEIVEEFKKLTDRNGDAKRTLLFTDDFGCIEKYPESIVELDKGKVIEFIKQALETKNEEFIKIIKSLNKEEVGCAFRECFENSDRYIEEWKEKQLKELID